MTNHDRSWTRRRVLQGAAAGFGAMGLQTLIPGDALASRTRQTRVRFLAWSGVNPDNYLIRHEDPTRGNRLEIRQIGNPMPMDKIDVKPEQEAQVIGSQRLAAWSFIVPGHAGLTAPNGWQIFGQQEGQILRIGLSNGKDAMELGRVQARPDTGSGTFAKTRISNAAWAPDSMRVIAMVHQYNQVADFTLDVEEAHGFSLAK